jgi:co-chaperonin GroES (HSP10)
MTCAEITREQIFLQLHAELPYAAVVETEKFEERGDGTVEIHQQIKIDKESQRAIVLGKGAPAEENGHEVPHGFEVGDEVVYVYHHNEKWSEGHTWTDGGPVVYVAQEEILAVVQS